MKKLIKTFLAAVLVASVFMLLVWIVVGLGCWLIEHCHFGIIVSVLVTALTVYLWVMFYELDDETK